jgi:nitrogen regulatory protein PII
VKVEIVAAPDAVERIVDALAASARTGKIGDGKVWVSDLDGVLRIRTGERDALAVSGD